MSQSLKDEVLRMLRHSSVPEFGNAFDAVSYAVHAVWRVLGARLIALSEDAEASTSLAQDSSLPDAWNSSRDLYCFVYRIPGLDVPVVVKLVRMASALHVHAAKKDSNTIFSVELSVNDYVPNDADFSTQATVYTDLNSLLVLVNERIVSQLVPSAAPAPPGRPWESGQDRDPLRIYPVPQPQRGGDFGGDLGPNFGPFGPLPGTGGGNLMGPHHPMFNGLPGRGNGRGRFGPRFDPFGPGPGLGSDPDRDHLPPPGRNNNFPF